MVCRGGSRKIPWYAVDDAVEDFAAGGATACHAMSRKMIIMSIPPDEALTGVQVADKRRSLVVVISAAAAAVDVTRGVDRAGRGKAVAVDHQRCLACFIDHS